MVGWGYRSTCRYRRRALPTFAHYGCGMWDRRLAEPVVLDNGEVLRTLRDVCNFIAALPERDRQHRKWGTLADCLFNAVRAGRPDVVAIATEQLRHALVTAPLPPLAGNLQKPPAPSAKRRLKCGPKAKPTK
jgi:hypothetical protein